MKKKIQRKKERIIYAVKFTIIFELACLAIIAAAAFFMALKNGINPFMFIAGLISDYVQQFGIWTALGGTASTMILFICGYFFWADHIK